MSNVYNVISSVSVYTDMSVLQSLDLCTLIQNGRIFCKLLIK